MAFVTSVRLKGLRLGLSVGLAALPLVGAGSGAAWAQFDPPRIPPVVVVPQPPAPPQPLTLPTPLQPGLHPLPSAPQPQAAPPAAAAVPAVPARRN